MTNSDRQAFVAQAEAVVGEALRRANDACRRWLRHTTVPATDRGRPRTFRLLTGTMFDPAPPSRKLAVAADLIIDTNRSTAAVRLTGLGSERYSREYPLWEFPDRHVAATLCAIAQYRPRRLRYVILRLNDVVRWADARIAGRERHAVEVWQAQADAAQEIVAEATLYALSKAGQG